MRRQLSVLLVVAAAAIQPAAAADIERFRPPSSPTSPLAQGVRIPAGSEIFFVSGQIAMPIDPAKPFTRSVTRADMGDTRTQTISALRKAKAILEAHGYHMSDVVKSTVYLVGDPQLNGEMDFAGMNAGFNEFFGSADNPNAVARATIQVSAVAYPASLVEIELIAAKPPAPRR